MFGKTIIAALIVASAAFALGAPANARPGEKQAPATEFYLDRASQNHDSGTGN